jgi:hypothetical protein
MLETFASVGVTDFDITHTNIDGEKRGFRPRQTLQQVRTSMPHLVTFAAQRKNNVIVRPHSSIAQLVQLDDLDASAVERITPVAFLVLATSPGNHQAWVAIAPPAVADLPRRLKRGTGADLTASGATRVAGTANFKRKYEPEFPIVAILDATPGRTVNAEQLEQLGLVVPPDPGRPAPASLPSRATSRAWPSYERCLESAPRARDGDRADVSRADFAWCLLAIDWGHDPHVTAARLMQKSSKARENGEAYARLTAERAAAVVMRRGGPAR